MTHERERPASSSDQLDQAFAIYLQAAETGRPLDRGEFLSQHPDLAQGVAAHERFDRLAAPVRELMSTIGSPNQSTAEFLLPGTLIGEYKIEHEIGCDGQGIVYKARSRLYKEVVVALKMLRSGSEASEKETKRFIVEVDNQAKLVHPNIVPIKGGGEHEGRLYFTMKLIEGGDLTKTTAGAAMSPLEAANLMVKISRAVGHSHERGILHRDLKPSNILLDSNGVPYVADFGLSKRRESREPASSRYMVGAAPFVAPEQIHGETTVLSDVYGLGAILYWLLTGRPPFAGQTREETLRQVLEQNVAPPRTLEKHVDRDLEAICLKCLQKDPGRRYPSAAELSKDLEKWMRGEETSARRWSRPHRFWRWCRRNPLVAALTATTALLLIAAATTVILINDAKQARLTKEEDDFRANVAERAAEIADRFSHYQGLLEELRGKAVVGLTRVEPVNEVAVSYANALQDPDYEKPAVVLAPGAMVEPKTLQRLVLLGGDFKQTLVRSRIPGAGLPPPTDDELRDLLTTQGKPITWVYVALQDGVDCTYPGTYAEDYDPRQRPWYVQAAHSSTRGVSWAEPYDDILGEGRMISCSAPFYDDTGKLLGVAGFDLLEEFVIREILKITKQPHMDAFLVDGQGSVLMPASEKALPSMIVVEIKNGRAGHFRTDAEVVAYFPLYVDDWYYVVVADSDHMHEVLDTMNRVHNDSR